MKKEIIVILICMLLFATILPIVGSIDRNIEKNENNENRSDEIFLDDDCGCGQNSYSKERNLGTIKYYEPSNLKDASPKPTVMEDLPYYFNWRDYEGKDWTTPAKHQRLCGSCCIFSALGALDSIINIREGTADLDVDLSEQYVLSCLPRTGNCFTGSMSYKAFYYILSNKSSGNGYNGIIPETCFPYRAIDSEGLDFYGRQHDPVLCNEKCVNWDEYLIPISDFGFWYPDGSEEDRDAIKTQVMQHGPIATYMMTTGYIDGEDNFEDWGLDHHDPNDYYPYPGPNDQMNHGVVIVGWKDDPSIGNGGYWICKNSWGPEWGYNGFFNIEYGSLNIDSFQIDWVEYDPTVFVNWQPVANTGGIYYGEAGHEIMFNGSKSYDYKGEIVSYEWDFGDGKQGYGETINHIYESQGVYPVKLIVMDNESTKVNDTTWAFIGRSNNPPDTPTVHGPQTGKIDTEYNYTFSAIDPEGDDLYYLIWWGNRYDLWIGPYPSGEEITINHSFIDKAIYHIHAMAKDCYDFKGNWANYKVSMPKNKPFNYNRNLLSWLLERFPHALPILKYLLKITLEWNNEQSLFWRE